MKSLEMTTALLVSLDQQQPPSELVTKRIEDQNDLGNLMTLLFSGYRELARFYLKISWCARRASNLGLRVPGIVVWSSPGDFEESQRN